MVSVPICLNSTLGFLLVKAAILRLTLGKAGSGFRWQALTIYSYPWVKHEAGLDGKQPNAEAGMGNSK